MDIVWSEALVLASSLLVAGAVSGFLAGLFGIGGGAVLVPVLVSVLGFVGVDPSVIMHVSVASSLGVIVPTSIRSFMTHRAKGAVDKDLLKSWVIAVPIGVVLASWFASKASDSELKIVFVVIAFAVALRMLLNRDNWSLASDVPTNPLRAFIGALIGFFSTLMGIGGGVLTNTFMTLCGRPIHQAVATSSGVGLLISVPGFFGMVAAGWGSANLPPFSLGYVNLLAVAIIIPTSITLAPWGAQVAHKMPKRKLEIGFGVFLLIVCGRFIYGLV
ncbi:sulfite exporter TauE/SafE family protein [Flexibacterium corallicola]|uniref:sulfite exporter TauE/SafE family protein n=1 Tax=Flexibacterium corallicola TaxID=3037259 RepID=UPI00286F22EB|nr:sulfite exporter TauE/SafE family protein [Pseudovibrio sp. M1P-2-3]